MSLTYKEVAEIIKIIDASNLDEFVFEVGGAKMHIRRNGSGGQAMALPASPSASGWTTLVSGVAGLPSVSKTVPGAAL